MLDPHRLRDVLDALLTREPEWQDHLGPNLIEYGAGDGDATWFRGRLQSSRDVDAVSKQIVALDEHIAEIDANPEVEAL